MLGLVNRAIEGFLTDTYGYETAQAILAKAGAPREGFEPMRHYDERTTVRVLKVAASHLERPVHSILEDIGTYLVWHPNVPAVRRLLRFCGASFEEFVETLDDLPARAAVALPDLHLPRVRTESSGPGAYALRFEGSFGAAGFLCGVLRAMADDFGALVTIDVDRSDRRAEVLSITVHDANFSEGRDFQLAAAP
jgi:hypothetical protein